MNRPHISRRGLSVVAAAGVGVVLSGCASSVAQPPPSGGFLASVAEQIGLPPTYSTASGTHTARGYTTDAADVTSFEGMKADCDNINLNKKLAANFRSDVFGDGVKGFFFKCENIAPDTNMYWFTISSGDPAQLDRVCDPATKYPLVYDAQHNTYWIDEPFTCTSRS